MPPLHLPTHLCLVCFTFSPISVDDPSLLWTPSPVAHSARVLQQFFSSSCLIITGSFPPAYNAVIYPNPQISLPLPTLLPLAMALSLFPLQDKSLQTCPRLRPPISLLQTSFKPVPVKIPPRQFNPNCSYQGHLSSVSPGVNKLLALIFLARNTRDHLSSWSTSFT